ncbi:DUF4391 domain-containing protein [Nocardioides sp. KIGAM211]|uniref:DUF4391 domain-containing protein n=1 Tax=Nocardioides luti TaxID=2761101 RepID=A0A7X0VB20_9ACTN|nr:DUF4391 domain-containing protein [Nocardioides luti]MBB6627930.1 DUF4391 domain-containing protein [Nocardioides luti]
MTATLYRWPDHGRVDRSVPKERLYAEAGVSAKLKQQFVDDVQRIRWAYKIGVESVRLAPVEPFDEFQVFEVDLKGADLTDGVLKAIDMAIPSPIIFELTRPTGEIQVVAARKELGVRGPRLSSYFRSNWQSNGVGRRDLPPALNLPGLYEAILTSLLAVTGRPGEGLSEAIERMARVTQLEREIGTLTRRLRTEPQLNRKIELRRELKAKQATLEELK